ncbi:sensor histidine kinase KdpD [Pelotomaculum sp. PtaB.Bin117]|uniref:sensor histidine kinase n=1 Tax=Pelotomaculum sp. PtaB.Bin117 TaxID=1811694 RepID=UPI0009C931E0|nr:sensor histidine kinase KdpD [Pelotomaculum sp. PtaB.Bin117]OPX86139.1 MAG: Sensor protein KdpD [Pelotomaculum sp. PtaB.Bin117]OPY59966.1 MAG: Sensor protein KdpD [Pelotomaculum sp. PtaU1.Bin065]
MEREKRADPDALLASLTDDKHGRLTVFLGAAAGVGKTYDMLEAARERLAEGVDVVIGWAETHGRAETENLLKGLPAVPPRRLQYRGKEFGEMDLDALLARRPQLALVDELAHTNIPGSRHTRRYQDVEELLAAGINVYTTLNIQHLETLNDIVAQVTGVTVRETVPDQILEKAAQIHLVDIPAEELIQRLKEGKVYVPGQAAEALRKFFRPGNINALRELALRYTAKRVDRQVESYMRVHGIPGPWPTGERVMVCISPSPFSAQLIRTAKRMAEGLKAEWLAVNVETPRRLPVSEAEKDRLARNKRLAEELGAETISLTGNDVAEGLLELAGKRNVSQIVIGKPLHNKFWDWVHGSIVDRVIRHSQGISIHVLPGKAKQEQEKITTRPERRSFPAYPYAGSLFIMLLVTAMAVLASPYLTLVNIAMIYLLPVLISAVRWGTGPAVIAAAAGILVFDYFFVPPTYSFTVGDLRYLISFSIFLLVAFLTGTLSARLRQQITSARQRETRTAALYALSREIAAVAELRQVLASVARKVAESVEGQVVVLLSDKNGKLVLQACSSNQDRSLLNENELAAATWAFEHGEATGRGTDNLGGVIGIYLPLRTEQSTRGVLGIKIESAKQYLQPEQRRLLEAFAGLAAVAVARAQLAEQAREAHLLAESERLRVALFNSLSHDLRTPLASIIGAVTGLLEQENIYSPAARHDLLQTIQQGAMRMNRFVGNLLDMARLESGVLKLNKEWCDIQDVVGVAVSRVGEPLNKRSLRIDIQPDLPLVKADYVLLEQVMVNLLDNALKYSDAGSEIAIAARKIDQNVSISVIDRGPNIPPEDLERVFDKFYRLHSPRQVSGTGLGLAISKGFIEAHGGRIEASNNPAGGVVITIILPSGAEGPEEVLDEGKRG